MINKFSCHNFRNIQADGLPLEKINLLIGPNNSGKSNFIKAITFLSDMLQKPDAGNMKSAFLNAVARNGWEHCRNKYETESAPMDFSWEIDLDGKQMVYRLSAGVGNTPEKCNIVLEDLESLEDAEGCGSIDGGAGKTQYIHCHGEQIGSGCILTCPSQTPDVGSLWSSVSVDCRETVLRQFDRILLENEDLYGNPYVRTTIKPLLMKIQEMFTKMRVYTSAQLDTRTLREPANIKNTDQYLNNEAVNFTNIFNYYKADDMRWKDLFVERMRDLIPHLKTADAVLMYDKLVFKLLYDDAQFDLSDVSDGTLRSLVLNMLINMPMNGRQSALAIDEPETNLHPAWQKVTGEWIQTSGNYEQYFISTHSPDFLDVFTEEFKLGQVAVFVFQNGEEIRKITYDDIADELGDWELGDLYRTNDPALGGWEIGVLNS